jgi:hypothetical protein
MPYCSIQEAWGESFYGNKSEPKRFSKIVPEFANPGNLGYYENSYPETDIYDKNAKTVFCKKKKKKIRKKKSFSRTYNRLPEHSGPTTRLPKKKLRKQRRLVIEEEDKHLVNPETLPDSENMDVPINQYDLKLEQQMNSSNFESDDESDDDSDTVTKSKEHFSTKESYVNYLMNENQKLKNVIEGFKTNSGNDNIFDLVLFLSTGVFIIFLLDTISKAIRKF